MDLAEIRKKARGAEVPPVSPAAPAKPVYAGSAAIRTQVQVEQAELARGSIETELQATALDPLDALFSASHENVGGEESYLQTLNKATEESGDMRQLLTFFLADEEYALDIEVIREIIKPREVTDLPRVPEFILGIISLRGIIIPIFDLKRRLKLGVSAISPASRIIVCQHEDKVVGLLVDSITQVMRVPKQNIEPPPAVLSGLDRDLVEGVGRYQGKMMILLHLPCVADAELV